MRAKGADTAKNLKLNEMSFVVPPKQSCHHETAGNTIEAAKRIFTPERSAWVRSLSNAVRLASRRARQPANPFCRELQPFGGRCALDSPLSHWLASDAHRW